MIDTDKLAKQSLVQHVANVGTPEQLVEIQQAAISKIDEFFRGLLPGFGFIVMTITPPRDGGGYTTNVTKNVSEKSMVEFLEFFAARSKAGETNPVEVKK